jgi:NAD dependent epimerase/dehydratase family enzyme
MATYLITGGTGLVGKRLIELIEKQGFSRGKKAIIQIVLFGM